MGFWRLLEVASMPMLQVLIISTLGAFLATDRLNLLPSDARRSLNKIVFMVFTPSLVFVSLAQTVTREDIISWWFMPVNIGLTFLFGGIIGWAAVKMLKVKQHLQGLVIATCSTGNLGNLFLILVPAICKEEGSPFGDHKTCTSNGLSYSSFSMAMGGFLIWSYTYQLIRSSAMKYKALEAAAEEVLKKPNKAKTHLLGDEETQEHSLAVVLLPSTEEDGENQSVESLVPSLKLETGDLTILDKLLQIVHQIVEMLLEPPTLAAILGFIFGAITWLRYLIIGDTAPLRVIQDSLKLLGNGTIPCITLILGGNLTLGFHRAKLKPPVIITVICVRYLVLPVLGICVVRTASHLGFLPSDPLFHFILMIQFTLPPAMSIGTITQLFDAGQEEASILFLWTYLVAALALTMWSTIYMWILS